MTVPGRAPGEVRDVLYRAEAAARAERVQGVRYALSIDLDGGRQTYRGRTVVQLRLQPDPAPLFLDFSGSVSRVTVDGTPMAVDHRDHRLWLPGEVLGAEARLEVEYENDFDTSGDGFHRFVDPEDGETYLYTNFEPFSAHRLFPCFDQPDIKATYALDVVAPAGWAVISAMAASGVEDMPDGRRHHRFPATPPFATYLLALIAGPWEHVSGRHGDIALGVYGRRSMRRELERSADEIMTVTGQGLDCYAGLFGRPYAFGKYDQLFVPEFNSGAMENVGAVTFRDDLLFRDPPTYAERLTRGEVVLHELAHMWFGDLVTMRWWDDLWLNETFATYLSYRALADATAFTDAWQVFNGDMRPAAHRQDQLSTTHPVAADVEHTDMAVANFDAITYEKGAAVIKQLVATIGDPAFRDGLRTYIERHAWGNATLADFLAALGEAAGTPLDAWARDWLRSPSLNTISVRWSSADGAVTALELRQSAPPQHPTLRPHSLEVALVVPTEQDSGLRVIGVPARIDGASQRVPAAVGQPHPVFVHPDHGDHDYALVSLDPVSLAFALERLPELPEAMMRQQTWSTLFDMVRAAGLPPLDYLAAVRRFGPLEVDRALLGAVLERAWVTQQRYLTDAERDLVSPTLVETALEALAGSAEDLRLIWARAAIAFASGPSDVELLLERLDDGRLREASVVDQEMRWAMAVKAVAHGLPGADDRLAREAGRDGSDRGRRALLRAEASRPDAAAKVAAWERINGAGYGSDYLTRAAIAGFRWLHQRELLRPFREPFYARLVEVYTKRDHAFAGAYLRGLAPDRWAEPDELARMRSVRAGLVGAPAILVRHLDEAADDLDRDIRVRAAAAARTVAGSLTAAASP